MNNVRTKPATEIKENEYIFYYDEEKKKYRSAFVRKIIDLDKVDKKPEEHKNSILFICDGCKQIIVSKQSHVNYIKENE